MKIAIATTTINIPIALQLYRKIGPGVRFFVAGDRKTPEDAVNYCQHDVSDTHFIFTSEQDQWKCSKHIQWNCIQRRNIALLEAIKWGADVIVFWDDDNLPLGNYFADYQKVFTGAFDGIEVSTANGWFDPGQLLTPTIRHRGMPLGVFSEVPELASSVDARVGVAVGLWIGDGDVNAYDRMGNPPAIHSVAALAQAGVVVHPGTKTVFNAQNVAFIRDLAPAMFQMPGVGRADDIFASLICQRIMREKGLRVHIGQPFTACWQNRSKASLIKDMHEEMLLLEHVEEFAAWLDEMDFGMASSVLDMTRAVYVALGVGELGWLPVRSVEAGLAFCDDCQGLGL